MKTSDLRKDLKFLYTAPRKVQEVTVDRAVYLYVDGQGEPGGDAFSAAMQAIYSVAYTIKFTLKKANVLDFKVPPPEVQWLVEDPKTTPMSAWRWRILLRIPDDVTPDHLRDAHKTLKAKKQMDVSCVRRKSWRQGRCLQVLHVGPYEEVEAAYNALLAHAAAMGAKPRGTGQCSEVYLNDPRRTAPEKLKTIVRIPISLPRPTYARGK